ncbi:MAG: hypothetical protein ACHQ1G_10620 [Planctomycetota bacterium]
MGKMIGKEATMVRCTAALVLLVAPVWAQDEEPKEEKIGEEEVVMECPAREGVELPAGRLSRGERDAPAVFVRVREAGVLQVKVGEEWKDTSLKDLAARLKSFAEEQDREMQKSGKSAYETLPGGMKASRLFVSIDAEPTVPWQNIQWVMTIAAEQKYYKLEMSDSTRRMLAFLPVDRGIRGEPVDPPLELKVLVHVVCRKEIQAKWGDLQVTRPTEVLYRIGDEETGALGPVCDYVRKAQAALKDTPNATVYGEIKAGQKAPFAKVLDVMETFEAAGLTSVNFFSTAIPPAALREAPRLPYPVKNYDTPD